MRTLLLFLLITICGNVFAQSWQPFPRDQYSYYRYFDISSNEDKTDLMLMDSSRAVANGSILYFKRKIGNPGAPDCRDSIVINFQDLIYNPDSGSTDSMWVYGDTLFSQPGLYLLLNAQPGQSWSLFGLVTIYCDSIVLGNALGIPDSIKYYHTTGSVGILPIVLSKEHGFLTYISVNMNTGTAMVKELSGISINGTVYGFSPPTMHDYIPYQPGDILLWQNEFYGTQNYQVLFKRDSITQVERYADSIRIHYNEMILDSNNNVTLLPGRSRLFNRSGAGNLLESVPNDLALGNEDSNTEFFIYGSGLFLISEDTVQLSEMITRRFLGTESIFYQDSCKEGSTIIDRANENLIYNTHQGLIYEQWSDLSMDQTINRLIGASIGGYEYGTYDFQTGITEIKNTDVSIYPNPANERIHIVQRETIYQSVQIFNTLGEVVYGQNQIQQDQQLDVSTLPSGIYFISLRGPNGFLEKKLIIK